MSTIDLNSVREKMPSAATVRRFAIGGAWFFIIVSLAAVGWVAYSKWTDPGASIALYSATVGDIERAAWGLSYGGMTGLIWAMVQIAIVSAAALFSVRGNVKSRRIAHGVLVGWAALWMLSLNHLARLDLHFDTLTQAMTTSLLFACTGYRAWEGWTGRRLGGSAHGTPKLRLVTDDEESMLDPDMIEHADHMEEMPARDRESKSKLRRAAMHAQSLGRWVTNAARRSVRATRHAIAALRSTPASAESQTVA